MIDDHRDYGDETTHDEEGVAELAESYLAIEYHDSRGNEAQLDEVLS